MRNVLEQAAAGCLPDFWASVPNAATVEAIKAARRSDVLELNTSFEPPAELNHYDWGPQRGLPSAQGQSVGAVPTRFQESQMGRAGWRSDAILLQALNLLAADMPLPPPYMAHSMNGQYNDCRDGHLRPDLVLVHRKRGADARKSIRIGTHTQPAI